MGGIIGDGEGVVIGDGETVGDGDGIVIGDGVVIEEIVGDRGGIIVEGDTVGEGENVGAIDELELLLVAKRLTSHDPKAAVRLDNPPNKSNLRELEFGNALISSLILSLIL